MAYNPKTCIAPFMMTTIDPWGNQSPCPIIGGGLWNFKDTPLQQRWTGPELTDFRQKTLEGEELPACHRCFDAEKVGTYSLRKVTWDPEQDPEGKTTSVLGLKSPRGIPMTPKIVMMEPYYKKGPMQIALKISNICNLRCRTCNGKDSYLFHREGHHYNEKYSLNEKWYIEGPSEGVEWTDQQIDEIIEHSANLRRLEIYGGEPLIDKKLPALLGRLIESGQSRYIDLNVSTNVTRFPSQEWIDMISYYKSFNLNLSIDGVGQQFEYLRHPARWHRVEENIHKFTELFGRYDHFFLLPTVTVSTMNIYYLPELVTYLETTTGVFPHLNLVMHPYWYRISNIHSTVKQHIVEKLESSGIHQLLPYAEYMKSNACSMKAWEKFKFWTHAMDEYRGESFADVFPELHRIMLDAGEGLS